MDYDKNETGLPCKFAPRKREAGRFRCEVRNVQGQTLVALLFFVMVGMIVTTAAVMILSTNSQAAQKLSQGEVARQLAETGAENALLQLLRNKNYTGETLTDIGGVIGDTVSITVGGTDPVTGQSAIFSTATSGNFTRKIEVIYDTANNALVTKSWKEIY